MKRYRECCLPVRWLRWMRWMPRVPLKVAWWLLCGTHWQLADDLTLWHMAIADAHIAMGGTVSLNEIRADCGITLGDEE